MSKSMQLIAITHLPQIAGKCDHHFYVFKYSEKNKTFSDIKELNHEERIKEIAKMLSNEKISDAAVATAKELIRK